MRSKKPYLILSLLSGVLLSAAWYWQLGVLAFFALVPLLVVEDKLSVPGVRAPFSRLFLYAYLSFFTWNILVTWWVAYASAGGAAMAFILNSLLMTLVFMIYAFVKKQLSTGWSVWLLVPLWLAWEHLHTLWDASWTWLSLGNIFAFHHNWIQWYEFTGVSGGTFWVLSVNVLVFQFLKHHRLSRVLSKPVLIVVLAVTIPVLLSYLLLARRLNHRWTKTRPLNTVVVQPNIDPYGEKFELDFAVQFRSMLALIKGRVNERTAYLVLPETFITDDLDEKNINDNEALRWFSDSLLRSYPQLKIVVGAGSYTFYKEADKTATARKYRDSGLYIDFFNSALQIDTGGTAVYHKSKLVPGAEIMPFSALLKPLESLALDMGGTTGTLGFQQHRTVFFDPAKKTGIAPVICYESVYGNYVTEYVRKGAGLIFIITNDGWWDDTPGYIQHLNYARLRAIENRRQIARSANTGVSCFIDEFGNISQATGWWQEAVISADLYSTQRLTFFSRYGDLISFTAVGLSIVICLAALMLRLLRRAGSQKKAAQATSD